MYPVKEYKNISTEFGEPVLGSYFGRHLGLDFPVGIGTEVFAPVGGRIRSVQSTPDVGLLIELDGDDGYYHRFLHLSRQDVYLGQRVEKGQRIALSGSSGSASTGPHLHWDIRKPSIWSDSFDNYIDPKQYVKGQDMPITAQDVVLAYQTLMGVTYKPTDQPILDYANSGRPAADVWKEIAIYAQEHKRDYIAATRADAQFVITSFKKIFDVDLPESDPNVQIYVGAPKDYVVNDMFANAKLQRVDVASLKSRLTEAQQKDVTACTEAAVKASKYDKLKELLK
jgi:hypothetical protein